MKKKAIKVVYILLPLVAVLALGVSSYLWYRAIKPTVAPAPIQSYEKTSAVIFSADLKENIIAALGELGEDGSNISRREPDVETELKYIYTINIPAEASLTLYNQKITAMVKKKGGKIFRGIEGSNSTTLTLTVGAENKSTDIIILRKSSKVNVEVAKMAIIVDDLGIRNLDYAQRFCNLGETVTLAILPFQTHTSHVVDLARDTETPYMLHMPMEPSSASANPGKGALLTSDSDATIRKKLEKAFRNVKGAEGLNNHMGSKATQDIRVMESVMTYLAENSRFFIDSQTSRNSVGFNISQKSAVKSVKMTGFIDVSSEPADIEKRLDELAKYALEHGSAIIICHDRPATIDVLEKKLPELRGKGFTFVKATDFLY